LAPPYLTLSSFGSRFAVLKKVLATLLELFGAPVVNVIIIVYWKMLLQFAYKING